MTDFQHVYKTARVAELKPWDRNARTHGREQIEQLRASIREFGFTNPVLIDEAGQVIAGHGRLMAAKAEGLEQVPAIELRGLSQAQKRALRCAMMEMEPRFADVIIERWQRMRPDDSAMLADTPTTWTQAKEERHAAQNRPAAARSD